MMAFRVVEKNEDLLDGGASLVIDRKRLVGGRVGSL
jgi:hypothetical protein